MPTGMNITMAATCATMSGRENEPSRIPQIFCAYTEKEEVTALYAMYQSRTEASRKSMLTSFERPSFSVPSFSSLPSSVMLYFLSASSRRRLSSGSFTSARNMTSPSSISPDTTANSGRYEPCSLTSTAISASEISPPSAPIRLMTAFALLLSGLTVTSGMRATAGER